MRRVLLLVVGGWAVVALLVAPGCSGDPTGGEAVGECPDDECVSCQDHLDCPEGTFCDDDREECLQLECEIDDECVDGTVCVGDRGLCVGDACEPDDSICGDDGTGVRHCEDGAFGQAEACETGMCEGGRCVCEDEDDCGVGEDCEDDICQCPGTYCGEDSECCGEDEFCAEVEICDEDGDCEMLTECRDDCPGEVCGFEGELCCDGDEPVCGPEGECAPDCEDAGELCGEDFDECCPDGEVCIFGECVEPGDDCEHFADCDFGEYCDEGLGQCLPDDFPDDLVCEEDYEFDDVHPEVAWQWESTEVGGTVYKNVMMTPVVADMNDNGTPDVIFNAYPDTSSTSIPVVADGETGETIYTNDTHGTDFGSQLTAANVTGEGAPEIVAVERGGDAAGVIDNIVDCPDPEADDDGCYLWWNDTDINTNQPAPVVADLNADGDVEIIIGDAILEAETGDLIARLDAGGYGYTTAVDVTGDGTLEVLGAGCLYSLDTDGELTEEWCTDESIASPGDRFVAAGDLDDDGTPEFVVTGNGEVAVVDGVDGEVLHEFPVYGGGQGGSPIVADFDGDGSAEFGVAGANCYSVYDLDCLAPDADGDDELMEDRDGCERPEIETCGVGRHCACGDLEDTMGTGDGVLWSIYVQDESSHRTGSSVFDFQGDGSNEVVYNDECLLMVLDGATGSPYFVRGNTNRTSREYPIIADVTGDERTNIVVSANNDEFSRDCEDPIANQPERFPECHPDDGDPPEWCEEGTHGVVALQDPEDRWVRTRSIWNQFDYYIDNAEDDGGVPTSPAMPWESHNTFRANQQGEVPLNAPDVAVDSLQVDALSCPPSISLQATVANEGMAAIPEGMPVSLYLFESDNAEGEHVETIEIDEPISPGSQTQVEFDYEVPSIQFNESLDFEVVANDDGSGEAPVRDCNPDRTSEIAEGVICQFAN